MLLSTIPIRKVLSEELLLRDRVIDSLKKFWLFSQFYGEYQALPPEKRRRFVETFEQQRLLKNRLT